MRVRTLADVQALPVRPIERCCKCSRCAPRRRVEPFRPTTTASEKVTAAQIKWRKLKAPKGAKQDAIKAQTTVTNALEERLGAVQRQIKGLDGTIALGACVA